jgi:hypothetical protein
MVNLPVKIYVLIKKRIIKERGIYDRKDTIDVFNRRKI